MARKHQKSRWLDAFIIAWALSGCALPHTRVILPDPSLPSDTTLGYHTEQDRHDIRLVPGIPVLVEHWTEEAFPFGQLRHSQWANGPYRFTSDVWFPSGAPKIKGEHCGWQDYQGVKLEGGKLKEIESKGLMPAEFFWREQNGDRVKCDLDVAPSKYNQAGY